MAKVILKDLPDMIKTNWTFEDGSPIYSVEYYIRTITSHVKPQMTVDVEGLQTELTDYFMGMQATEKDIKHDDRNATEIINRHIKPCEKCEGLSQAEFFSKEWESVANERQTEISQLQSDLSKACDNYKKARRKLGIAHSENNKLRDKRKCQNCQHWDKVQYSAESVVQGVDVWGLCRCELLDEGIEDIAPGILSDFNFHQNFGCNYFEANK